MDLNTLLTQIDENTARAMVEAMGRVFDALVIEAERIEQTQTPPQRDYNSATLSREAPGYGWISDSELRRTAQHISEAIAQEKWIEGFTVAVRWLQILG